MKTNSNVKCYVSVKMFLTFVEVRLGPPDCLFKIKMSTIDLNDFFV